MFWLLRIDHIWFSCSRAAECLAHPCSSLFFLDLWKDLFGFRYFVLYGFQLCCTVLCGLVLACGSTVVWRSSRSLRGFGDFSPTLGRIQPLSGIKHLPAACSILSCYETYWHEDRAFPRTFLATVPIRNAVGDAGQINCSSFSYRTKEEAERTTAHRRCRCARFGDFDTQEGIPGLVGGKWDHRNLRFDSQTLQIKYYQSKTD
jgi:hypothetical protein